MAEQPQSPLFAHDEVGPRFTIKDLSRALTRSGIEYPTANARIANFAKNRQIHVREKGVGATSPNKYALADVAAAMLLSAVQDAGIADNQMLSAISNALYFWGASGTRTAKHPILAALLETVAGAAMWQLQVDIYRHSQSGERTVMALFYRAGEVDPNATPPEPDAVKRLREAYPGVQIAPDPRVDRNNVPVASILIPAFNHLLLLRPLVDPTGN